MFSIRSDIEDAETDADLDELETDIRASLKENNVLLSKLLTNNAHDNIDEIIPIAVRLQYLHKVRIIYIEFFPFFLGETKQEYFIMIIISVVCLLSGNSGSRCEKRRITRSTI